MKILLVHPAPKIWTKAALIPLGIAYIASYLEKNGFPQVEILDFNVEPKTKLPKADIVGITATTPLIKSAWKIAKIAKSYGAVTVIGGPHVSALPQESAKLSQVDFVCVGEGEQTMLELVKAIADKKKDFSQISGLVYKKGKKIIVNKPRIFLEKLDSLPSPAYHLFKLDRYTSTQPLISTRKPSVGILTSRGCPYGCNFCYKGTFGRIWRPRSVENVLNEWEFLVKELKIKEIALMDDGFNIDINRALEICRQIKKRGLVIPWRAHNGIRADRAPKKLLTAMKEAGCYMISFGVESGCQEVLNKIGKNIELQQIVRTFKLCRSLGIISMAFFMIGNPGETKAEIEKTIEFSQSLDPDIAQFSIATPFPGTGIFQLIKNKGKININDWDKYSQFDQRSYFDFGQLKGEEVVKLANLAYRRFYLRPITLLRLMKRRETWLNLPNVIRGASHYLLNRNI